MKSKILALAALLSCFAVGSEATPIAYVADLSGPAESPANSSPGTGFATVVFDDVAHTMQVYVSFQDLVGLVTASHIHCCTATPLTANAGVATQVPTFIGFPLGVTSGLYSDFFDLTLPGSWNPAFLSAHGGTPAGAEAALSAGLASGRAYLNIHTNQFTGGEIRGFLTPEPGTIGLVVLGLGAAAASKRKRRA